jgi:hypothetical protein
MDNVQNSDSYTVETFSYIRVKAGVEKLLTLNHNCRGTYTKETNNYNGEKNITETHLKNTQHERRTGRAE